jgi:hypothetical protein
MTETVTHIRHLFLDPKDTYTAAEAADILGLEPLDLKKRIESGEVEGLRNCCGVTVPRKELIAFALNVWPQATIEKALGDDLPKALPKLVRLAAVEVRLPRFELLALQRLAQRDGTSVDVLLGLCLLDLVSAESDFLTAEIPGFSAALRWPG